MARPDSSIEGREPDRDRAEAIAGIRQGIEEWRRGEGSSVNQVFARLRAKYARSNAELSEATRRP
jgi:hypothetical protein